VITFGWAKLKSCISKSSISYGYVLG